MAEKVSTDTQFTVYVAKDSIPLETCDINSGVQHSESTKTDTSAMDPMYLSPFMHLPLSTTSIDSIYQYIKQEQSIIDSTLPMTTIAIDQNSPINFHTQFEKLVHEVDRDASSSISDNDSFDDEYQAIFSDPEYSSLVSLIPTRIFTSCPVCYASAVLHSSSCCTFACCNTCWSDHISYTINDGRIKIPCISSECNKYLTREIIVNFIRTDSVLYERYLKFYACANQNPRAKICPRCSHLYNLDELTPILPSKSSKKSDKKLPKQVQCSECSLVWCFRCSAPWHENLTCKQFVKGDKLVLKWMNQKNDDQWNARKCPKCSSFIQRAGGCPHMTCSSCSCEFCYLCGRRYGKIPWIGQHNNRFSMFGCPYNFHAQRPWLRRTIRGLIATGVVVASPIIVAGAVTAAVTVLPSLGIYRLVRRVRSKRREQRLHANLVLPMDDTEVDDIIRELDRLRQLRAALGVEQMDVLTQSQESIDINEEFPLSVFANMDVENLFTENDKLPSDFQTCPITPTIKMKKGRSQSLENLPTMNHLTVKRRHSIAVKE